MCKSKNLYRLFLNNNNIQAGDVSRWTINFPNWISSNKECYVWIETAQAQVAVSGGITITDDCIMLNSNLQTQRIYSQNYEAIGTQLAQFNGVRFSGNTTANEYLTIDEPTTPIYVASLPNSVEFWLSNDLNTTQLTLTGAKVNFVLVIDFIDDDE
jgi:hypothetical protein